MTLNAKEISSLGFAGTIAAVICAVSHATGADEDMRANVYGTICGPRCAKYVLSQLGHDVELFQLVDELQPRPLKAGCSLLDLAAAFERRGFATYGAFLDEGTALSCPYLAIVHLRSEGRCGHFVVQVPSTDVDTVTLWLPDGSLRGVSASHLAAIRSGAVLLVSSTPLDTEVHRYFVRSRRPLTMSGVGITCAAVLGAVAAHRYRRRSIVKGGLSSTFPPDKELI